jgi:acyl carrier protein
MTDTQPAEDQLRRELHAFIDDRFLYLHPDVEVGDADQLLELGVIDSLGFVELVEEVQDRYGIAIQDVEITEENLGSVSAIVAFIARKRGS